MKELEAISEETLQQTIDKFWETFPPVWHAVRAHTQSIVAQHFDISVEQFHILRHIRKGIQSVSELADAKQTSRPAVSQAVEALVEKGLVTRVQSATDRRYVRLDLTPEGARLLSAIFAQNRSWMMEKLAPRSNDEIQTILQALDLLNQTFSE